MSEETLRIGEVASRAGVNVQTLRYYERRGLLPEPGRSPSGYRHYPPETVRLVRFIKRAQELGFTLKEIAELIALREGRARGRGQARAMARAKIRDIDEKTRRLGAIRKALEVLVDSCARRGPLRACPILEALDDPVTPPRRREGR